MEKNKKEVIIYQARLGTATTSDKFFAGEPDGFTFDESIIPDNSTQITVINTKILYVFGSGSTGHTIFNEGGNSIVNNNISIQFEEIRKKISDHINTPKDQNEAQQLLDDLRKELLKENRNQKKIDSIYNKSKKLSQWFAAQLVQGAAGAFIQSAMMQG